MTLFKHDEFTSQTITGLLEYQEFSDVTLATADDEQFYLHRIILSASSPFFKSILTKNVHSTPFLYLQGMMHEPLKHLVEFMYTGQCKVPVSLLNCFLKMGRDLEIQGLDKPPDDTGNIKELPKSKKMPAVEETEFILENDIENPTEVYKDQTEKYQGYMETFEDKTKDGHEQSSKFSETSDQINPYRTDIYGESEHCPDIITLYEGFPETTNKKTDEYNEEESKDIFSLNLSNRSDPKLFIGNDFFEDTKDSQLRTNLDKYYPKSPIKPITKIMEKETYNKNQKYVLQNKITFGEQDYKCEQCEYRSSYKPHIKSHQYFAHKKVSNESLFPCGKCDKVLFSDLKLGKHNNLHHNPDAHKCDTCGKILSNRISLKSHKLVKHSKDKNHFCNICNTGFVSDKILKIHIEGVHEKKYQFACPYCDTVLSHRSKFKRHSRIFHEGKQLLTQLKK